jgi:flagellar biosynthesis/type III secretory pathway M-ring protein FliF/YscJ
LPAPAPTPQLPGGQETPALAAGAPAEEAPALAEQAAEEVEDELDIASLKPAPSDDARYLRHLAAISRDDPEAIVEVIESWLRED